MNSVTDEFKDSFENLPPQVKAEVEKMINGFKTGSIDPQKIGQKVCGYCGNELDTDCIMCETCQKAGI